MVYAFILHRALDTTKPHLYTGLVDFKGSGVPAKAEFPYYARNCKRGALVERVGFVMTVTVCTPGGVRKKRKMGRLAEQ
jgi:hypothetical protein